MARVLLDHVPTFKDNDCCPFLSGNNYCLLKTDVTTPHGYTWEDETVCFGECDAYRDGKCDFSKCRYCTALSK